MQNTNSQQTSSSSTGSAYKGPFMEDKIRQNKHHLYGHTHGCSGVLPNMVYDGELPDDVSVHEDCFGFCEYIPDDDVQSALPPPFGYYHPYLSPLIVKFKKLDPRAAAPIRATDGSAGWDLTAVGSVSFNLDKDIITYGTGLAVEIPKGYVGLLFPRSSIDGRSLMLTNSVGIIDSDYRGEILMKYKRRYHEDAKYYAVGDRVGQLIIIPYPQVIFVESDTLSETARGTGGYGSTGK